MIDETSSTASAHTDRAGFCQDCGRPLTRETIRTVGSGVFCEPCLESRLSAAGTAYGGAAVPPQDATVPPPPVPPLAAGSGPNPALAAVLGLIPGVGAMYNGQFAKGIAHIVIFALLQSLVQASDIFGFLLAGWIFYQAFDAYHTAKARREGLPLPDPFGLNNIGDHFRGTPFTGSSRSQAAPGPGQPTNYPGWTGYTPPPPTPPPPAASTAPPQPQASAGWQQPAAASYSAPYSSSTPYSGSGPATNSSPAAPASWGPEVSASAPETPVVAARRVPVGAIWLIGLGLLFLAATVEPNWHIGFGRVVPFILIALAVWLFAHRMTAGGGTLIPGDGERSAYDVRLVCSLRGPLLLLTFGVLLALQAFDILRMGRTWPILFIVLGTTLLLERTLGTRAVTHQYDAATNPDVNGRGQ